MKDQPVFKSGIHFLIVTALLVILIAGVHLAHDVLMPFLLSIFLSVLGTPLVRWLKSRRVPIGIAVLIVILMILLLLVSVGMVVATSTNSLLTSLPVYQVRLQEHFASLSAFLSSKGIVVSDDVLSKYMNADEMTKIAAGLVGGVGSVVSNLVMILLTVSFILLEAGSFPNKIRVAVGNPRAVFPKFTAFVNEMQRFMIFQTIYGLVTGAIITVWLLIFGVDFAVLLGLVTFVLCYVPNVGSAIALVVTVAVTFVQYGLGRSVIVAAGYLIITFILGSVIQPRLMGKMLGLSTLVIFLSVIFWGNILGIIGMMLCVPLTMALKFALESNENTAWIGVLLERDPHE
jgi:predicted PurR-regulated permease PerM